MSEEANARNLRATAVDDAIIFTAWNAPALVRLGLVPLLCAFLGSSVATLVYPGAAISQLLYFVAGVIFAVGVHCMIIRDENPGWVIFRFGREELAYIGVILIYILVATSARYIGHIFSGLFGSAADTASHGVRYKAPLTPGLFIIGGIASIAFIWALLRSILVFPHAAVRGEISLAVSWNAMSGNIWRLFSPKFGFAPMAVREALFPIGLVIIPAGLLSSHLSGQAHWLAQAVATWPVIAIAAAVSSYVYKDLVAPPAEADGVQPRIG